MQGGAEVAIVSRVPVGGIRVSAPTHHLPGGGFRNPWPVEGGSERGLGAFLRWRLERRRDGDREPPPAPGALPIVPGQIAYPRAAHHELRITWVGHSTLLLQVGGRNLLTDPIWSDRASPVQWAGPTRLVPPGVTWDALPEIDAVLISHDHYDHLDRGTVLALQARFGPHLRWFAPLGFRSWFRAAGVTSVRELDWWQDAGLEGDGPLPELRLVATPAQHWSRRSPFDRRRDRLWCSWVLLAGDTRLYFGGDSGWFPGYSGIGARFGPFQAVALPIGAYAPRWFMRPAHMDPAEAVRAYRELGGRGAFVPIHWGTFRLTDEPVLEPPELLRRAWSAAGLDPARLALLAHGQTLIRRAGTK
jgi:N-acyl-phosphatidylethanolamine-hydrolysing phospholipase D